MMIDEVVDRAMAFIEKDQFSEKWIYTSKLFYKNKLLPLFTDKKEFDSKIIIHLIDEYTSMYENSQLSRSTFNSRIRWLRILLDISKGLEPKSHYKRKSLYKYNPSEENLLMIEKICTFAQSSSINVSQYIIASLRKFFCYLEEKNIVLESLTDEIIIQIIFDYKQTHKDIRYFIKALDLITRYLKSCEIAHLNLNLEHIKARRNESLIEPFDPDQISKLIEYVLNLNSASGSRFAAFVGLTAFTGIRGCDAVNLKFQNIDWDRQLLMFTQLKTQIPVVLPIPNKALNLLGKYIINYRKKPIDSQDNDYIFMTLTSPIRLMKNHATITKQIQDYSKKILNVEVKKYQGLHSIRRMFATKLVNSNVDSKTASQMLGHTSFSSDDRYMSYDRFKVMKCALDFQKIQIEGGVYFEDKQDDP